MKITITGYSDDLMVVEGDIEAEFTWMPEPPESHGYIAVSDGTLLRFEYDNDGIWRFTRMVSGNSVCTKVEGDVAADTFDVITLSGAEYRWIVVGIEAEVKS